MLRTLVLVSALALAHPAAAQSGDQTLADIRQELSVLWVEMQRLKRELVTTGAPSVNVTGTSALDRIAAIEAALSRMISKAEELENRVNRVVSDGTNRIGDLEFRLCELEPGCDIASLGDTPSLGGETGLPPAPAPAPAPGGGGAEMAVGEQADFDRARAAFEAGDYAAAAEQFQRFTDNYPGGPLNGEAHFWRGEALSRSGDIGGAARAYLDSFSGDPDGIMAPDALLQLGLTLDALGQRQESCVMLGEVTARFPSSAASLEAQSARGQMGCV